MSPQPYVRWQAIALGVLIAVAAGFDAPLLAFCVGVASLGWLLRMHVKYLRDLAATTAWIPKHREELDRIVAIDPLFTIVPATIFASLILFGRLQPLVGVPAVYGAASALAPAAAVIWGSSLVDWYLILPRISGQLGHRPCRAAEQEEWFPFPESWREVTRWWYIHRVVAALAFRLGLSAAIAAVIVALTGIELLGRVAGGLIMLMFGSYAVLAWIRGSALAKEVGQAGHVKGIVSQTVTVQPRAGRRSPWHLWRKQPDLKIEGRRLVIDVALESIQLVDVEPREQAGPSTPLRFEKNFDSVPLADVNAIRQGKPRFSGCGGRCSGINWYCIENPRCFYPK